MITHEEQQKIWDEEHRHPHVLKQMDSDEPSGGVVKFHAFLKERGILHGKGVEMGCGKGRNVIWLAQKGYDMSGFDFSPHAIVEAARRAEGAKIAGHTAFGVQDATELWPYGSDEFDFGVDCFATTDIESPEGRRFAVQEMHRVLKPGTFLLAYLLSTDDEFHKTMVKESPSGERNAFLHTTGKFEKTFDEQDVVDLYRGWRVIQKERISKKAEFSGREYNCLHFWIVLQK